MASKQRISTAANPRDRHRPRTGKRDDRAKQRARNAAHKASGGIGVQYPNANKLDPTLTDDQVATNPEVLKRVEDLAAAGVAIILICRSLGIPRVRFNTFIEKYPAFAEAYAVGHAREEQMYDDVLRRAAADADSKMGIIAAIYQKKSKFQRFDTPAAQRHTNVTLNLPNVAQPMTRDQYLQSLQLANAHELPAPDGDPA